MKAYRSPVNPGTLILNPQDEMDSKVLDYIERVMKDSIVESTEHNFMYEYTTLIINTRHAPGYEYPPPPSLIINGVVI